MKKKYFITKKVIRGFIFNKNVLLIFSLPFILGFIMYYYIEKSVFSICPLMNLTHIPCPTCGLTRAFIEITHLNLANAIKYNIFVIILAPLFVIIIIVQLLPIKIKKVLYKYCIKNFIFIKIFIYILILIFLSYGIVRTIDHFINIFNFIDLTPRYTLLKIIKKFLTYIFH